MTTFTVEGPFTIPRSMINKHPVIDSQYTSKFWKGAAHALKRRRGCYVFMTRAGQGYTPWYVGKATCGFRQEIFTPQKLLKYNTALAIANFGTPVLFFVVLRQAQGAPNVNAISEAERFLIGQAKAKNPRLLNKTNVKQQAWRINGVVYSSPGQPSQAAKRFRIAMGL